MKLPNSISKLLENKYVLYFVLFLSIVTILGYLVMHNIKAVIFFMLVGYLVYCFNKNKVVILLVPLVLTSILVAGKTIKEGLENNTSTTNTTNTTSTTSTPNTTISTNPVDPNLKKSKNSNIVTPEILEEGVAADGPVGATIQPSPETGFTGMKKNSNNRIDYAATVEDAYDDLNKILGGDGIKRLTDDTQKLMGQQMKLAEAMKGMGPLMEQAKDLMKGFDVKGMGNITDMAKQFTASA